MIVSEVRREGLWRLTWAGLLFLIIGAGTLWLDKKGWHHVPWEFFIPGGFALAGALQLVSGVPFSRLSAQWASLAGWQRGVLGITILVAAAVVIFTVAAAYVIYFAN
jgi:hypothetical protein